MGISPQEIIPENVMKRKINSDVYKIKYYALVFNLYTI